MQIPYQKNLQTGVLNIEMYERRVFIKRRLRMYFFPSETRARRKEILRAKKKSTGTLYP